MRNGSPEAPGSVFTNDWTPAFSHGAQDEGAAPGGVPEESRAKRPHDGPWDVVTGPGVESHVHLLYTNRNLGGRAKMPVIAPIFRILQRIP